MIRRCLLIAAPAGDKLEESNKKVEAAQKAGDQKAEAAAAMDASLAIGYKAPLGDSNWDMDVSVNHGRSEFGFSEGNSANVSWWYEPIDPANPAAGIYGDGCRLGGGQPQNVGLWWLDGAFEYAAAGRERESSEKNRQVPNAHRGISRPR